MTSYLASRVSVRSLRWLRLLLLLVLAVSWGARAEARPMRLDELPPELRSWAAWVLHDLGDQACPQIGGAAVCVWPGVVDLQLDERGGRFSQQVSADRAAVVVLPGSRERWPQEVELGGKPVVVEDVDGRPSVRVPAGSHQLRGKFFWSRLPEQLALPTEVAQVVLAVNGQSVMSPHRGEDGSVWLAAPESLGDRQPEQLELQVFRQLRDEVPPRLETRMALRVGGRARELRFERVLPPEARALGASGDLPLRLQADGALTVQLRPGNHVIVLDAVIPGDPDQLTAPRPGSPWVEQEVWVFAPDPRLRQLELSGALGIDPKRTNLPEDWTSLRAMLLEPGSALRLQTIRRGEAEPPPNRITLERHFWLDLDGEGYTVRDIFGGHLAREHRLALTAGSLGRAQAEGRDQLIVLTDEGHSAVELRRQQVDLEAEWRIERGDALPAVGWSEDVEHLSAQLHLPPGWELFGATGVDDISQSWISRWNLFDVFYVLVMALAVARLVGAPFGVVAFFGLALTHGEPKAPYLLWAALVIWAGVLVVAPRGRLRWLLRAGWWGTAVLLAVTYMTFAVDQARRGFFPETAHEVGFAPDTFQEPTSRLSMALEMPMEGELERALPPGSPAEPVLEEDVSFGMVGKRRGEPAKRGSAGIASGKKQRIAAQQDPEAVVQTGPGLPTWRWRTWHLSWSGPVERTHELRLWLIAPWQNTALALLRIALAGALLWALLRRPPGADRLGASGFGSFRRARRSGSQSATAAAVALAFCLTPAQARGAQPSDSLLGELRERLLEARACDPNCVTVPRLEVSVQARTLRLEAEVHAAASTAYQLPGPAKNLTYSSIQVNGRPSTELVRYGDGFLHLRLEPGLHRVVLTAPLVRDELVLALGTPPKWVRVSATGFQVDGLGEEGHVDGSLTLTRVAPEIDEGGTSAESPQELPPWFLVQRDFSLGVRWSVSTVVRRVSPPGAPAMLRLPLLAGEKVTESGLVVDAGHVVLSFDRDTELIRFESSLKEAPSIQLAAPSERPWSERWSVDCAQLWRCGFEGAAPYEHHTDSHDYEGGARWRPSYRPWPGEAVSVSVERLAPAPGAGVTVDGARLELEPGTRITAATLELRVRSSSGGTRQLMLPGDARAVTLSVNDTAQPLEQKGRALTLALAPGTNVVRVTWQEPEGLSPWWRAPEVKLAGGAVNAEVVVKLPRRRWLLGVGGGGAPWGPAVLFWPYLLLIGGFGLALSRVPRSPLKTRQWLLLGLGLGAAPAAIAVLVASWFFLLAYRERYLPRSPGAYNVVQMLLVGATVAFVACLIGVVYDGLVVQPDMAVAGRGSTNDHLVWYVDRVAEGLPRPIVVSVSLWVWRIAMLAWALWLALALLGWLRWGWDQFGAGGAFRPWRVRAAAKTPGTPQAARGEVAAVASDQGPSEQPAVSGEQTITPGQHPGSSVEQAAVDGPTAMVPPTPEKQRGED